MKRINVKNIIHTLILFHQTHKLQRGYMRTNIRNHSERTAVFDLQHPDYISQFNKMIKV